MATSNRHSKKKDINLQKRIQLSLVLLTLCGCSGLQQSEQEKIRGQNAKGEYVYRRDEEFFYSIEPPQHRIRELYPWEQVSRVEQQNKAPVRTSP